MLKVFTLKTKYKLSARQPKPYTLRDNNNPAVYHTKSFENSRNIKLIPSAMNITSSTATSKYTTTKWEAAEIRVIHFFKNLFADLFSDKAYLQKKQQEMLIKELQLKTNELENIKRELVEKNEMLRKISYHQSHTIRRPLANILGITKLINNYAQDKPNTDLQKLSELLRSSSVELDEAIKNNN